MKKTLLALSLALLATTPLYAEFSTWGAFINVEGDVKSNGDAQMKPEAFIPVFEGNNNILYIDLRGYLKNPSQGGINLGFGYRQMLGDNIILGANAFYDNENTEHDNVFHQAGLGLEVLSERAQLRMNFYLPQGQEKEMMDTQVLYGQITDGNFEVVYKQGDMESAMPGMDAVFSFNQPLPAEFYLTGSLGGYMYFGGEFHDNVYGFAATLGIEKDMDLFGFDSTLYASGGYGWNNQDGHHGGFSAGIKIPLGTGNEKGLDRQLYSSVKRESDIKTNSRLNKDAPATYDATATVAGKTYSGFTELDANDDVASSIENLGDNTLVHLRGEEGVIHVSSAIDLNEGQTIIGSGYTFEINGPKGQKCYVIVDSEQAEIFGDANDEAVFNLADRATVANLNLSGNGPVVVYGENIDSTNIVNINFDITDGQTALMINGGSNINIKNIDVNAATNSTGTTAMQVEFTNGTTIKNLELTGLQEGLILANNNKLLVKDSKIILSEDGTLTSYGVMLTENINTTIDNVNVYGNEVNSVGIMTVGNSALGLYDIWTGKHVTGVIGTLNSDLKIDEATIEDNEEGLNLQDNTDTVLNKINANDNGIGIKIEGGNKVKLTEIVANDNDTSGISIINVKDVYVEGLVANDNGESGVIISEGEELSLNNVVANNNGQMGIFLYQVSNVTGDQIEVSSNVDDGIYVGTSDVVVLDGLIANNNGSNGAYIIDVTNLLMENIQSTNNLDSGIAISDSLVATVRNAIVTGSAQGVFVSNGYQLDLDGVAADENVTTGIMIDLVSDINIVNSTAEKNWVNGIRITFADNVYMEGVVASNNGSIGVYFHNVINPTTTDVTVEGNGVDFVQTP